MTCFWDGIFRSLLPRDKQTIDMKNNNIYELIKRLKKYASENGKDSFTKIKWNGSHLTTKEIEESLMHIESYDSKTASRGYWCSTCDPFLITLCAILRVKIIHKYLNNNIVYMSDIWNGRTIIYTSNRGHFSFIGNR